MRASEKDIPARFFHRMDESPDEEFYLTPRFVPHIDQATIDALTEFYREFIPPGSRVLDLMSSWISHLPPEVTYAHVSGLGMNAEELAANERLDDHRVHDLNERPELPFADACFDAVLNAVSIQYLTRPVDVFREVARVLVPGGRHVVATSHRMFPTKAIRAWHVLPPPQRIELIQSYFARAGGFTPAEFLDRSPERGDPLWLVVGERLG